MTKHIRNLLILTAGLMVLAACGTEPVPPVADVNLTVDVDGSGSGTVTSSPAGIDTAATNTTASFAPGTEVTLTAVADAGSTFAGFTVAGDAECENAEDGATCVLTMSAARTVTATFNEEVDDTPRTLTVVVNEEGEGEGSVTSDPAGIDCPDGDCTAEFAGGTSVVLTAAPTAGVFTGWSGDACDGLTSSTCSITIGTSDLTVTANFDTAPETVEVTSRLANTANSAAELLADSSSNSTSYPEGWAWNDSSDIDLGYDTSHAPNLVGLRFPALNVPAGAVVQSAVITFTAHTTGTPGSAGTVPLTITAEDTVTPAPFLRDANGVPTTNISGRTTVGASVSWPLSAAWTGGETYDSVDFAEVVQAVVDHGGWASGTDIVILIDTEPASTEYRRALPSGADDGPLLTVTYTLP